METEPNLIKACEYQIYYWTEQGNQEAIEHYQRLLKEIEGEERGERANRTLPIHD